MHMSVQFDQSVCTYKGGAKYEFCLLGFFWGLLKYEIKNLETIHLGNGHEVLLDRGETTNILVIYYQRYSGS